MADQLGRAWWIWNDKDMPSAPDKRASFTFTKEVELEGEVRHAFLRVSAQGTYGLTINDRGVGGDDDVVTLDEYDIRPFLRRGKNRFAIRAKTNMWYAGLFLCGAIELANGAKVELLSDRSWRGTKEGDAEAKPAGEVVRGVNGGWWNNVGRIMVMPEAYYRLNTAVEVPGINWAKPFAGRKLRVLAIHPRGKQRDTVELAHRTDMEVSAVFPEVNQRNHEHSSAPFFPVIKGMSLADVAARLREAMGTRPDVIILGGLGRYKAEELFYGALATPLKSFVASGGGLVYAKGAIPARTVPADASDGAKKKAGKDRSFEDGLTAQAVAAAPLLLAMGTPFHYLPGFQPRRGRETRNFEHAASLFTHGRGRIVRLERPNGGRRGYGLFANVSGDLNDLHYQYYMAFAIKAILWAGGQEPEVRLKAFPASVTTPRGEEGNLTFTIVNVPKGCEVSLAIRSPEKLFRLPAQPLTSQGVERGAPILTPVHTAAQKVEPGQEAGVSFGLPTLPAGSYLLDVTVTRDGRKANWGSAHLEVASELDIAQVRLSKEYVVVADGKADEIGATVALTAPAPERATVRFALIDNYYRVVAGKEVEVAPGATEVSTLFPVSGFSSCLGMIRAELRVKGQAVAIGAAKFTAVRRDWDRFTFFAWTAGPLGHQGNVYLRVLAGLGLDASQYASIGIDWLEAADRVALPGYPFPRLSSQIADPEKLTADYRLKSRKIVESQLRFDPVAFSKGNEFFYGGGEEQPARIKAYRQFLREKYGDIAALNQVWGSQCGSFEDVFPVTRKKPEQLGQLGGSFIPASKFLEQAKATKNYSRLVDQWLSNYRVYMDLARVSLRSIKQEYPQARVGMDCPMWPHAKSGHDWYAFMQEFDFFAPYGRGGEIIPLKQARSYKRPGQFIGMEYGGYLYMAFNRKEELTDTAWQKWRLWCGLLQGFTSIWWYQLTPPGLECNLGPGFEPYPTLQAAATEIARIRRGYYTLFRRLPRDYGPIAVHDSVLSRITSALLPREFASGDNYGRNMDVHVLMHILENICGYQYTFVSDPQIAAGKLSEYRVLMMPLSIAVAGEQAKALRQFVETGGAIIADVRPGVFDGSGKWDEAQTVPSLFGLSYDKGLGRRTVDGTIAGELAGKPISIAPPQPFPADPAARLNGAKAVCSIDGIPLVTVNEVGKGRAICLNIPFTYYQGRTMPDCQYAYWGDDGHNQLIASLVQALLSALDVPRVVPVEAANGKDWLFGLDVAHHRDGRAQYVGITKRRQTDEEPPEQITLTAPRSGHVYDMFTGKYLGERASWSTTVNQVDVQLFGVLPYRVAGLEIDLDRLAVAPGGTARGKVTVGAGAPVRHVIHLEAVRPDGRRPRYLAQNLETTRGAVRFAVPLALNEPRGEWRLEFTDVATQAKKAVAIQVR